jgi:flagellar assembly protein FliH
MSSSPRREPQVGTAAVAASLPELQPFPYDSILAGAGGRQAWGGGDGSSEAAAREAKVRTQARQEAQAESAKQFDDKLARERESLSSALAQFTHDRAAYFQKVEGEVVQLALGIARKILHRESQLDPLLLAGIVRVALEKIDGATGVALRIHPQNAADWRRYLTTRLDPADLPQIVEDPAQPLDGCVLETSMGTATIGLDIQLKEIEQGLMDLLAARPGSAS